MDVSNVQFNEDLVEAALHHLDFLENISSLGTLLRGEVLQHALRRYEQLWLPLAIEYDHAEIVPPVDIGWLWYIHMLSPLAYKRDCRKAVGRTLDHKFKHPDDIVASANRTVEIWYKKYPKSGYNIIRNGEYAERKQHYVTPEPSKLSVSLTANAVNHLLFFDQVSLPHFRDRGYLEGALKRYKQFLCLKKLAPDEFLTPCVDIILMWYTHMCNPVAYAKDLTNICGQILDNNVKVKYALIDQNYISARDRTNKMWSKISRDDFVQPGTKLRSSENKKEIFPITLDDLKSCCVIDYDIYLTHIELLGHPEKYKFELKLYLVNSSNGWQELVSLKGNRRFWSVSSKFPFNTHKHKQLKVVLLRQSRLWCFRGYKSYANGVFNLKTHLQGMGSMERALDARITMESMVSDSLRVDINGTVVNAHPILCQLWLVESNFDKRMMKSALLRRTWGHYKMPDNTFKEEHEINMAVHTLQNQDGVECFKCRLIHIPDLLRSGVEVFFHNKLVATSYVIGSSHLPGPNQVQWSDLAVSFDPELGERAMLLRNHRGDWAICVARWVQESTDDHLDLRIMKLGQRNKLQRIEIRSADVQLQSFNANLHTGSVQINPSNNTVAENLATLWSLCILYVLCAPKDGSRRIKLGETGSIENIGQEDMPMRTVPESECRFLVAAGMLTESPSNEMITKTYGSLKHDILMDAQDVIIAEQKLDHRLQRKEGRIRSGDLGGTPKKLKKRKSSSSMKSKTTSGDSTGPEMSVVEEHPEDKAKNQTIQTNQNKQHAGKKRKKLRKKKSSGLDDMLPVSDDSFTKEDVEELDKVLVTNEKGQKVVKKKDSDYFDLKMLERDVFDKEAKEDEEYFDNLQTEKLQAIEELVDNKDTNKDDVQALEIKEHTTIIKDIAEKKQEEFFDNLLTEKLQAIDDLVENKDMDKDDMPALEIKEHTTIIKDIAEKKRELISRQGKRNAEPFIKDDIPEPDI